jgi:hypothetical protein
VEAAALQQINTNLRDLRQSSILNISLFLVVHELVLSFTRASRVKNFHFGVIYPFWFWIDFNNGGTQSS